jgi:tetratricopeptide (TPR) repeat protein
LREPALDLTLPANEDRGPPSDTAARRSDDDRLSRWIGRGALLLTAATAGLYASRRHFVIHALLPLYTDWVLILPLLQVVELVILLWRYGVPTTRRGWVRLSLWNCWLAASAVLYAHGNIAFVLELTADLVLRVAVVGLWSMAILGVPYALVWLWRWRRAPRPRFTFGRWWFSTLVLLAGAEPLMSVLERDREAILLPEHLPDAPKGELRIALIGSSTMTGYPYEPKFGIAQVLAWRVRQMYPQHRVVTDNLAVPGISLKDEINSLRRLKYRPHLVVLYGGHNEFFHELEELGCANESFFGALDKALIWSPTFRVLNTHLRQSIVLRRMKSRPAPGLVDDPMAPPELLERRQLRFRRRLELLAEFGRAHRLPMLWYVPVGSESGFEPNRSCVRPGTAHDEVAGLLLSSARALERERTADWEGAAEQYTNALSRHPEFAEFHFRLGECLLKLGRTDEARQHFEQALDGDGRPVRATRPYRAAFTEIGVAYSIPVVQTGEALRAHTNFGILDRSLFHDNVHPTLRGFYYMGIAGADLVASSGLLQAEFGPPAEIPPPSFVDAITEMKIDRTDVATALRRCANGLRWLSRLRFDDTRRQKQANNCIHLAERLEAAEIEPGEEGTESLQ